MVITWLLLASIVSAFTTSYRKNTFPFMHQHQSTRNYETKDGFPGILRSPVIAVLTLERHQKGIWISKLMEALSKLCEQEFEYQGNLVKVRPTLYTLESFQMSNFAEADVALMDWLCFVNRVSDAASPTEVKACQAVLSATQIWNIPVYNGAKCYAIGSNKLLHHHVFVRAGLHIPRSTIVAKNMNDTFDSYRHTFQRAVESFTARHKVSFPLLVKPNSGGFGKGIRIIYSMDQLPSVVDSLYQDAGFVTSDGVVLIQEYIEPFQDKVYRVWFLDGKIQCAVERQFSSDVVANEMRGSIAGEVDTAKDFMDGLQKVSISSSSDAEPSLSLVRPPSNAFTGGCAGGPDGSCSLDDDNESFQNPSVDSSVISTSPAIDPTPWPVPANIVSEIEALLSHVGEDCYAGSIEFLFQSDVNHRVYFDLNMLSTLPLERDEEWMKLAQSIVRVALREK